MTVDLEGFTYLRQDQKGVLLGIYEINHEHWAMDGAPWDYGMELFLEQTDRIENEITLGFQRYPCLQEVGVKTWVNGAFTFSPDFFNHFETVASVILSPKAGTKIFSLII